MNLCTSLFMRTGFAALILLGAPIQAFEFWPQQWFTGLYGHASNWISSSFLVTRKFVASEFEGLKNKISGLENSAKEAQENAEALNQSVEKVKEDQRQYQLLFARLNADQRNNLNKLREQVRGVQTSEEFNAQQILSVKYQAGQVAKKVDAAYSNLATAQEAVENQKEVINSHQAALISTIKQRQEQVERSFKEQNAQLAQAVALLEANRRRIAEFNSQIEQALVDSRKRIEEKKSQSDQLERLYKQAEENGKKTKKLADAFVGFKTAYYAGMISYPQRLPTVFAPANTQRLPNKVSASTNRWQDILENVD